MHTATPPPVAAALSALGVAHRVFVHSGPVYSLAQAAAERGQQPAQVIRSLLFRVSTNDYVLVLMAGDRQVNWKLLRRHLGTNRVTTAEEAELLSVTGYPIGAVGPFGLRQSLRMLADPAVFAPDEISLGSGVRGTSVIMRSADLRAALPDLEVVALA